MKATIAMLFAAPLLFAACVALDEGEDLADDEAALVDAGVDPADEEEAAPDKVSSALPPGCSIWASPPTQGPDWTILGEGNWSGCPSNSQVTVLLRRHRAWWPDQTLAELTKTGASGWTFLQKQCYMSGSTITVYVETRIGPNKVQSARRNIPCGL